MQKYYLFDRGVMLPQGMSNLRIRPCLGRKDPANNPFFREDFFSDPPRKWEVRYDNAYPNVIYDPEARLYRLYYTLIVKDTVSEQTSLEQRAKQDYVPTPGRVVAMAYAQSQDGVHWEKPSLGMVSFQGSTDNNLMMLYAHGTGVFRDGEELDPAKRYKLVTKVDYPGSQFSHMAVAFSPDGLHWSRLIPWPQYNPAGDSHNLPFRDPTDGKFKLITRIWKNNLRISAICESTDFINWSEPKEILRGWGFESQVYSMPVFWADGVFIGLASMFHEGNREAENFDCVDCELTYGAKMENLDYVAPGEPCIPRGQGRYPWGEWDCCCIYAAPPVEVDGQTWVYYMGGNGRHTNFRETSFGRASFEKDRWAFLEQIDSSHPAVFHSAPFHFYGEMFEILADVEDGGRISVELKSGWNGESLEGFRAADAVMEEKEKGVYRVRFAKPFEELGTMNPCIHISFERAKVYTLRGDLEVQSKRY